MHNGMLVSQNRKYLAKSPEHDAHFRTILRQQEAATIKDPGQAAMVASDQMELRGRLRHSLQTSDDDVYEVESAPVMKSTPYHRASGSRHRKQRQEPPREQAEDMELPVSVNFESNIDHTYEPQQQQQQQYQQQAPKRHRSVAYDNQMPMKFIEDGEPTEPDDDGPDDKYERQYPPVAQNMHFSMGLGNEEDGSNHNDDTNNVPPRPSVGYRQRSSRSKAASYHQKQQPAHYHQVQYNQAPVDDYQQEKQPRYYAQTESEYRGPGSYSASAPATSHQYMQRGGPDLYASQPQGHSPKYGKAAATPPHHPMESSWLDMGAYSSGKGAFGWYSDVPVGGTQAEKKK